MLQVLAFAVGLTSAPATTLTWRFDSDDEVVNAPNVVSAKMTDGLFRGTTNWDPYIYLRLPQEGVDGREMTRLTLRLYSSAPADHVAVYYQCDDGRWALGQSHAIVRGLAEYRIDLTQLRYGGDVAPVEGSRQWGGVSGRIRTFRIDPGNEAGRWIALDEVRLAPADEAPFVPGVAPLTVGGGKLLSVDAPKRVSAGESIRVRVAAELPDREEGSEDRLLVWLVSAERVWADALALAGGRPGRQEWTLNIPTLKYAQPTRLSVRAGLLGAEVSEGGFGRERGARVMLSETHANNETCIRYHESLGFLNEGRFIAPDGDEKVAFSLSSSEQGSPAENSTDACHS